MKSLFALIILLLSFNTWAVEKKSCSWKDDDVISRAIYNGNIRQGAELVSSVIDLRALEASSNDILVVCDRLASAEIGGGISGSQPLTYEILGTSEGYLITIGFNSRGPLDVTIQRK